MNGGGSVLDRILAAFRDGRPLLYVLVDPDGIDPARLPSFIADADAAGVDGFFVGGSLTAQPDFSALVRTIHASTRLPVVIFPGGLHHISGEADAILFLSIVSGRNADALIGQHVLAAPIVRRMGLEAIATAYLLVDSGAPSSAEFMSNTRPMPRDKPDIAAAHAMAAEILGFRLVYLEGGSGARESVPDAIIRAVRASTDLPLLVGGGIRTPEHAADKVRAGASLIVIGNHFERHGGIDELRAFTVAVHAARQNPPLEA